MTGSSTASTPEPAATVSRDELVAALRSGDISLVDVLSPESYATAHIDGAINVPVAELRTSAAQALPDRNAHIVVYCGGPT
jgi:rhodanese-related sulfurtransferase